MPPRSFQTPNALDVARASAHADASGNGVAFASAFASSGPEETTQNLFSSIPFTTFRPSPESSTSQAVQLSSFVEPQTTTALAPTTVDLPTSLPTSQETSTSLIPSSSASSLIESFAQTTTPAQSFQTSPSMSSSTISLSTISQVLATVTVTNSLVPTAVPSPSPITQSGSLTQAAKVGLGVGLSLGLLLLFLLAFIIWRRRRDPQVDEIIPRISRPMPAGTWRNGSIVKLTGELEGTLGKSEWGKRGELDGGPWIRELSAHYKPAELPGRRI